MKDLPADARPREKLLARGSAALADAELLALLLRTGVRGKPVLVMAQELLDAFGGLHGLLQASETRLRPIKGLGPAKRSELLAVLDMNGPEALTIVNGYKDESMMRLAMLGIKLGKKVIVVVEKPSEVGTLIRVAQEMQVRPLIGLRSKLQTQGSGSGSTPRAIPRSSASRRPRSSPPSGSSSKRR